MQNELMDYILLTLFVGISVVLIRAGSSEDKGKRFYLERQDDCLNHFYDYQYFFWACFEQAGTCLFCR